MQELNREGKQEKGVTLRGGSEIAVANFAKLPGGEGEIDVGNFVAGRCSCFHVRQIWGKVKSAVHGSVLLTVQYFAIQTKQSWLVKFIILLYNYIIIPNKFIILSGHTRW
jgi:hypothetical protein